MITHDELLKMWEADVNIDRMNLDTESLSVSKLHHKYVSMLIDIKTKKIAYNSKLEDIRKNKELYYSGQATSDTYKEKPFDLKLKTRSGIARHVETDPEYININQKIEYMNILEECLDYIIAEIKWRNQNIKNAIDWIKFQSGGL